MWKRSLKTRKPLINSKYKLWKKDLVKKKKNTLITCVFKKIMCVNMCVKQRLNRKIHLTISKYKLRKKFLIGTRNRVSLYLLEFMFDLGLMANWNK